MESPPLGRNDGRVDWVAWHDAYEDPSSSLSARLRIVRYHLSQALDRAPGGPVCLVSLCAGQVLGVRLAMLGLQKLGIDDPQGKDRKRLVTFVEIDRCATDAVAVVTGCRLGKRALKFRDWGKVAATFVDVSSGKAIRIAAKESSKELARQMHPEIVDKNQQQMRAYREISDADLFTEQWVKVELPPEEFPGYKGERITCEQCGEGINFRREVRRNGKILCRSCAGECYYKTLGSE